MPKTKIPKGFNEGVFDGWQCDLFGNEVAVFVADKYCQKFRAKHLLARCGMATISKKTGITVDTLDKLKSGEWKASPSWWEKFFAKLKDLPQ